MKLTLEVLSLFWVDVSVAVLPSGTDDVKELLLLYCAAARGCCATPCSVTSRHKVMNNNYSDMSLACLSPGLSPGKWVSGWASEWTDRWVSDWASIVSGRMNMTVSEWAWCLVFHFTQCLSSLLVQLTTDMSFSRLENMIMFQWICDFVHSFLCKFMSLWVHDWMSERMSKHGV